MSETPEMSELHKSTNILSKKLKDDEHLTQHLTVLEDTTRRMHETLRYIVAGQCLQNAPEELLDRLRSFGVLEHDDAHALHIQHLTYAAADLNNPQKPHTFFDKYHRVLPLVVQHDILASQLIADLLLWRAGLLNTKEIHKTIDEYSEIVSPWLLS